jgi:hypothetical protein
MVLMIGGEVIVFGELANLPLKRILTTFFRFFIITFQDGVVVRGVVATSRPEYALTEIAVNLIHCTC